MDILCLDLEGVLIPEIWQAVAARTGIDELNKTTRDIPVYDDLMQLRLGVLREHDLSLSLKLSRANRNHSDYGVATWTDSAQNPLLRKYNLAERVRLAGAARIDWNASEKLSLGLGIEGTEDDYNKSAVGLTDGRTLSLNADVAYAFSDSTRLRAFGIDPTDGTLRTLGDTAASWRLGPDAIRTPEALARAAAWDADNEKPRDLRQATLVEVWSFVAGLPRGRRREAVSRILDWARNPTVAAEGDIGAPLTAEELAKLAASPLIDIGGHTESHCDLSRTPALRAAEEITRDRDTLRDITGQPVDHFAHPYGRHGPDTREHLRSAGYVTATTSGSGVSNPLHDPYWLPRIQTPDIGGEEFERLISWMTGLPRPRRSGG